MNNKKPLVSIIIPVYNVETYLTECLDSVLNQTYSNIELITVDDGSIDQSPEILLDYAKKHKNMQVIIEESNQGQATARNIGLQKAKGEYILFVDSDDFIDLKTVEELVAAIEENDVDFVRFSAQSFSVEGEAIRQEEYNFSLFMKEKQVYTKDNFKNVYLSFSPSPVLYLFKKALLSEHDIQFKEHIIHEDELFSSDIFFYAESCVYIDKPYYHRRYRQGSTMTERSEEQRKYSFDSYVQILKRYNEMLESNQIDRGQKKFIEYRINSLFVPLLNYEIDEKYKQEALNKVKTNKNYYTRRYKNVIRLLKAIEMLKSKVR